MIDLPREPDASAGAPDVEEAQILALEERLRSERPVPMAVFQGELRECLLAELPDARPHRVRRLIAAYAASGLTLIAIATLGVAGMGPLAA